MITYYPLKQFSRGWIRWLEQQKGSVWLEIQNSEWIICHEKET